MIKKPTTCKRCKKQLRDVGIVEQIEVYQIAPLDYSEESESFEYSGESEIIEKEKSEPEYFCANCDKKIASLSIFARIVTKK